MPRQVRGYLDELAQILGQKKEHVARAAIHLLYQDYLANPSFYGLETTDDESSKEITPLRIPPVEKRMVAQLADVLELNQSGVVNLAIRLAWQDQAKLKEQFDGPVEALPRPGERHG